LGLGFDDGGDDLMEIGMLDGEETLAHEGMAFGGPTTSSPSSTTCQKCQDVTQLGHDVIFLGFLCVKIKFML
jgi:hypothetical protein